MPETPIAMPPRPSRAFPAVPAAAVFVAGVLALGGCGGKDAGKAKQEAPATVTTTRLQAQPWNDSLEAIGTASARESVAITAKVSDVVTRLAFDSGERVRAGQLLADMNSAAQRADVAAAQAQLRDAEQQLRRGGELAAGQLIARGQLDTLRANRDAAAAALQARRAAVADRTILAPFAGVLGLRQVSPGALVTPGTVITTLDDTSLIRLDFTLPEATLASLAPGQAVTARSDAYPGEAFDGRIADIDSRVDPQTRAVKARAELPNPDGRLRPGMLLRVSVALPARRALVLPELAVQQEGDRSYVFRVVADGKGGGDQAEEVPVVVGTRQAGKVEIRSGLRAGDRVVVEGTVKLRPGSRIVEAGATP